ncbi:anthranilate synthase component I family protein [Paenibacillus sp. MBLB4367]|uniref:anthranilate synthase component I family protein n=1 Tax=Paenibacillus sp. MBLB4367 TaxID=3384767 RepID=UPI003907E797
MIVTSLEQWKEWSGEYSVLPLIMQTPLPDSRLLSWGRAWQLASESSVLLESGKGGRYSFLGLSPVSVISGKGREAVVTYADGKLPERLEGDPLPLIKKWMAPFRSPRIPQMPKFVGGCVGFLGYDIVRSIEKLPQSAADDLPLPDYLMMRFDELYVIDHEESVLYCAVNHHVRGGIEAAALHAGYEEACARAERMARVWLDIAAVNGDPAAKDERRLRERTMAGDLLHIDVEALAGVERAFGKAEYMDAVRRIQRYIEAGDVFQVNLSVRQSIELSSEPEAIYEWLRLLNPSPYMGLMRTPGFQLVSGSPELLVQVEGETVRTRPIAGTRPRGANEAEDRRLADELIWNEKERAEHIMLVDLERNDVGKIARYGSVRVDDLMVIEYYSHVMHIVSEVRGERMSDKDAYDIIAATFPGGTITGAPKVRTMQIIEELEPVRRGPYTGSMGWIDYNGNMELNILIRTLVTAEGKGYVQAGAGIVIDSVPEKEYIESLNKAKALWKAIQYSANGSAATEEAVASAITKGDNL